MPYNTTQIRFAYKSKRKRRQVILLLITGGNKWHYLLVKIILKNLLQKKKLSLLVAHCLDCVHLMQQKTNSYYRGKNCIENLCKGFRDVAMKKINYKEKNDTANL